MIIGTAGHIDHGKSLLVEALTGIATDRLKEEKARGISIELGFAYLPIPDSETPDQPEGDVLGFVDVPGHERFVHTMVAGSTGIDFALIVIAADDGVMPQTREHIQVLDLLGISEGVVALNKIDLVDAARQADVEAQVKDLLEHTSLEGIDILPVSAADGSGIDGLRERLLLEAASLPERPVSGTFRMAIDRSFTLQGAGTIVTGAVKSGRISIGDKVLALPSGLETRIRSLHAQGRESTNGTVGQRCALNLAGIEKAALGRGDWLVEQNRAALTDRFDADFKLLDTEERAVRTWYPVHLHVGTSRVPARVVLLEGDRLSPGDRAMVQIVIKRALPLVHGDLFLLRDASGRRTLGGGRIIDPLASRHRRRSDIRRATRAALSLPDTAEALDALLEIEPGIIDLDALAASRGVSDDELEEVLQLVEPETFSLAGVKFAAAPEIVEGIGTAIEAKLIAFHSENPDLPGMPRAMIRSAIGRPMPLAIFDTVISELDRRGVLGVIANAVRLPSHTSSIRAADQQLSFFNDSNSIGATLSVGLVNAVMNLIFIFARLAILMWVSVPLTVLYVLVVPFQILVMLKTMKVVMRLEIDIKKRDEDLTARIESLLQGALTVKAFGFVGPLTRTWKRYFAERLDIDLENMVWKQLGGMAVYSLQAVGVFALLFMGVTQIAAGKLTLGTLLAVLAIAGRITPSLTSLIGFMVGLQEGLVNIERFYRTYDLPDEVVEFTRSRVTSQSFGERTIRPEDLSELSVHEPLLDLGNRATLRVPVDFVMRPGRRYLWQGPNGAGKTSLALALAGLLPHEHGSILCSGAALDAFSIASIRAHTLYGSSAPFWPERSLAANFANVTTDLTTITGRDRSQSDIPIDEERLERALSISDAHEVLRALPGGMRTVLSHDGHVLSRGENQRLFLAMMLYRDPRVLILDETLSNVTELGARRILERIGDACQDTIVVLASQRRSDAEFCDEIIAFQGTGT